MNTKAHKPLAGRGPAEVPLARAPLVRVIAQVRFPTILAINNPDKVAVFQEQIREIYPYLSQEKSQSIELSPSGPTVTAETIWRFVDREVSPSWRVSLGVGYVALEAFRYKDRSDFHVRLRKLLNGLKKSFKPADVQRIGVRYVNRLEGEGWDKASDHLQPQILGISAGDDLLGVSAIQVLTESALLAEEGVILARWGTLQPNATYDPDCLPPLSTPSWVIDLDISTAGAMKFDVDELCAVGVGFSERIYAVFRQMVTQDFLRFYGGEK